MIVLVGGVMVLLLVEDGSGVGGGLLRHGSWQRQHRGSIPQLKSVLLNSTYNAIGSLAKRGGS